MRHLAFALPILFFASSAHALDADPTNYTTLLPTLKPGDVLTLSPGTYTKGLNITGLQGTEAMPIVITGPAAVFEGNSCCNTVEIKNSSYVVVKGITVDGKGLSGVFGVSAKDGLNNVTHHITIEGCTFVGQGASQQTVGISTKTPTWGWVIRRNRILGAGTGMYLGNSNGDFPFIDGIIEENLIKDTIGYNIQIKYQNPWPSVPGIPAQSHTILRNNVFIKNDAPSPDGDRPNVLVGGFPATGPGSQSMYEIYGNLFYHNPRESLLQASGRVSVHDNLFVDASDVAVNLRDHDLPLKLFHVYNNTIYAGKRGVLVGSAADESDAMIGNLIFADTPISGPITNQKDNMTGAVSEAGMFVAAPSKTLGAMDFYPLPGKATGTPLDLKAFAGEVDYDEDFNGSSKGGFTFRGAYAGEGKNPGWTPTDDIKVLGGSSGSGGASGAGGMNGTGGMSGVGAGGMNGAGGGGGSLGGETGGEEGGCGCRAASGAGTAGVLWLGIGALGLVMRRRRGGVKG